MSPARRNFYANICSLIVRTFFTIVLVPFYILNLGNDLYSDWIILYTLPSLFELANDDYIEPIQTEIEMVLTQYEPRVRLQQVVVESKPEQNALDVSIQYKIVGLNSPSQNVQFILEPTRL